MNPKSLHIKQVKFLLISWAIICGLLLLQLITTEIFEPDIYQVHRLFIPPSIRFFIGGLAILFLIIPAYNYFKDKTLGWKVFGLIVTGLFTSILLTFLYRYVAALIAGDLEFHRVWQDTRQEIIFGLYHNVTYYLVFLSVLLAIDYLGEKLAAIEKRDSLSEELALSKLNTLQHQLQPHFLFNALNGISSIVGEKKEVAQDMIADLSDLLRNSLDTDFGKPVLLEQELALLNAYLNIEQKRFEHQLNLEIEVDPTTKSCRILPFLLQPVFENAIKHGFTKGAEALTIRMGTEVKNEQLIINIQNNGSPLSTFEDGVGLSNIKKRLETAYKGAASFRIEQQGAWVCNTISLPQS